MTTTRPVCASCVHFAGSRTCSAFPRGIPDSIWRGPSTHLSVVRGQTGTDTLLVESKRAAELLEAMGAVEDPSKVPIKG